ncbi:MAG: alpha/beta hydrolase [Rhodocyclaceae bacterium]|nr:MAG: alpha/beta hydrolase [Rhodocyclaceae bacterium]
MPFSLPRRLARIVKGLVLVLAFLIPAAVLFAYTPLSVLNLWADLGAYRRTTGLHYGNGPRQAIDLYWPDRPTGVSTPLPVVVFFYGGSWNRGERDDYRFVASALAQRGMVVMVPDYRLYPEAAYPAFLQDAAQALAWGLEHASRYGGDPRRVFVIGHSAGAYNAAMLALDSRWLGATGHRPSELAGWVGLAGPYNFLPIQNPEVKPVFHWPATPADSQPLAHVSGTAPPALLIAPKEDEVVDPEQNSAALYGALKNACVEVILKRYGVLNHATSVGALAPLLSWLAPVADDVAAFIVDNASANIPPRCALSSAP